MNQSFRLKARHKILTILFITSIVSFVDRTAMTVALPFIKTDFHLTAIESGLILSAFFAAYSIVQIPGGLLADRFGVRKVTTVALLWWSAFTALTGLAGNFTHMIVTRFLFGLGEGVYPTCTFKTVATWFPRRSRGTANAIMLSSSRLGQAIAPLVVIWIIGNLGGWRYVFISLCLPGVAIAALFWCFVPNSPAEGRNIAREELEELDEDNAKPRSDGGSTISFWQVLRDTTILRYLLIYFVYDFAYWGYMSWLPTYLIEARGFTTLQMGVGASLPLLAGTFGCILGGWVSDRFFSENRRLPVIVLPIVSAFFLYLTTVATSVATVMVTQTVLGLLLNFFAATFWALPISTVPKEQMGVSSGIINTGGQIAAAIAPVAVGGLITVAGGSYSLAFVVLTISLALVGIVALSLPAKKYYGDAKLSPIYGAR